MIGVNRGLDEPSAPASLTLAGVVADRSPEDEPAGPGNCVRPARPRGDPRDRPRRPPGTAGRRGGPGPDLAAAALAGGADDARRAG